MNNHLRMRCFIVFMLLSYFCCENVFSQVQKVSINVRNVSFKDIIKTIERQTTYRFLIVMRLLMVGMTFLSPN